MAAPPSGTVTLLFSDIEGSTRLLRRAGEAYPELLNRHRLLLREAFERVQGCGTGNDPAPARQPRAALVSSRDRHDRPKPRRVGCANRTHVGDQRNRLHGGRCFVDWIRLHACVTRVSCTST